MKLYVILWFGRRTTFKLVSLHAELPLTLPTNWSPKILSGLCWFVALPITHLVHLHPPLLTFCSLNLKNYLTTSASSFMLVSFMTYSKLLAGFLECTESKFRFMFHFFCMITDRNIVYWSSYIGHMCFHISMPIDALKKRVVINIKGHAFHTLNTTVQFKIKI